MKKIVLFWIIAFIITAASAVFQRMTGPTYPLSGKVKFEGKELKYKFDRSHSTTEDCKVSIAVNDESVKGVLFWRKYKFDKEYNRVDMKGSDTLTAYLPKQPSAGKLEYYVELYKYGKMIDAPKDRAVVIRFKDDVPIWLLIPHVIFMFAAMLISTRTGLEYFNKEPNFKKLTAWTVGILVIGGFILGPLVQQYAFGALWTGFPFGYDLTDNKTLIAGIAWLFAWYKVKKSPNPKIWVLIAAVVMLIVFLIPHSVLGSELDYSKIENQ
jgi:hypothetical protein